MIEYGYTPEIPQLATEAIGLVALAMAFRKSIRHEVRRRQEGMCDECGAHVGGGLQTHHRKPESLGGTSERIDNAVGLCGNGCHQRADELAFRGIIYPQVHWDAGYFPDRKRTDAGYFR